MHAVSWIDAENVPTGLRSSPVEVPVIIGRHLHPSALLKVIQQNWFIHVGAEADFHALVLIVSDSEICVDR